MEIFLKIQRAPAVGKSRTIPLCDDKINNRGFRREGKKPIFCLETQADLL